MPAPAGSDPTITFLSGVTSDAKVAAISFGTWTKQLLNPPQYDPAFSFLMKWGSTALQSGGTPGGNVTYFVDPGWDATAIDQIRSALNLWSAVANITFTQVQGAADFSIIKSAQNGTFASPPPLASAIGSGAVNPPGANASVTIGTDTAPLNGLFETPGFQGGDSYFALVHEFGHIIGLGHAGPYNASDNPNDPIPPLLQSSVYDMQLWSMLSYITPGETNAVFYAQYPVQGTDWGTTSGQPPGGGLPRLPTTPMMLDILAAQRLYGVPTSGPLVDGNDTFGFNANLGNDSVAQSIERYFDFTVNQHPVITIWDGGVNNTLDLSGWSTPSIINLNPGTFSSANGMFNNIAIASDTVIETGIGGGGNDLIIGNSRANFLLGNDGFDTMIGGPANDTIDGGAGGGLAVYSGSLSQFQLTQQADGSPFWHVSDQRAGAPDGIDALSNVQFLQFTDTNIDLRAVRNFDGLNRSDFAWQQDGGQAAIWLLRDTGLVSSGPVGTDAGASWHLEGSGDFDGDGRGDFLWQDDSGQAAVWLINGTNVIGGGPVGSNPGPSWHVIDTGDFSFDIKSDILLQNDNGQAAIWLMNGTNVIGGGTVGSNPGASWHVIGAGDFNADLNDDILWQNDNGQAAIWLMDGVSMIGGGVVGSNPGPSWHVKGAGDFNGDGKSDILWQNDSGQAAIWLMNGTNMIGGGLVGSNPGASWHVVGAGQFGNVGDIKSDILWQNDSGQAAVWLMDGTSMIGGGLVGGNPGADWHLIA
jgi:serralysin